MAKDIYPENCVHYTYTDVCEKGKNPSCSVCKRCKNYVSESDVLNRKHKKSYNKKGY